MSINSDVVIRTVVLAVALVNQILVAMGISPLPLDDEILTQTISALFTMVASMWAWFKNNSITDAAKAGDVVKDAIKDGTLTTEDVEKFVLNK